MAVQSILSQCRFLWEVLEGLSGEEQRRFLLFVTGSPRMPVDSVQNMTLKISKLLGHSPEKAVQL